MRLRRLIFLLIAWLPTWCFAQQIEKIKFDKEDSTEGYYLAIQPQSKNIKGLVILLTSFLPPEILLTETKLHSVAYTNDLLTVVAPMKRKLYADQFAVNRINTIVNDLQKRFHADLSKTVLAGYDDAGNIALRYTELCYETPGKYPLQPKAVFGIDSPVDLFGLWHWSEGQIKKNFWPGAVGDAKFYLETMTREHGTIDQNAKEYQELTPFYSKADSTGNERFLKDVAVRLYYDVDIEWQLANRRNSLYDTKLPDASELVKRLLLIGNKRAEFIASKKQGVRNNGIRHPTTISIVDEVECIQWIKNILGIFDPMAWVAPYKLQIPKNWETERFSLPADFAPGMSFKGVEDLRFTPGWGDNTREDYWSYAYLWWLDEGQEINTETLEKNLTALYTGLVNRNIVSRKIDQSKTVPTFVKVRKVKTLPGDMQSFSGQVHMLDYMEQRPIVLNTLIQVKACDAGKTAVLVQVSPKPYTHQVWQQFKELEKSFSCN
jgi:hypothetical protein